MPAGTLSTMDDRTPRTLPASVRLLLAWVPIVGWAVLIFALSATPNLRFIPDPGLDFIIRKGRPHGGVRDPGAAALARPGGTTTWRRPWAWAFAFTVLYAASDEFHQEFVAEAVEAVR